MTGEAQLATHSVGFWTFLDGEAVQWGSGWKARAQAG